MGQIWWKRKQGGVGVWGTGTFDFDLEAEQEFCAKHLRYGFFWG